MIGDFILINVNGICFLKCLSWFPYSRSYSMSISYRLEPYLLLFFKDFFRLSCCKFTVHFLNLLRFYHLNMFCGQACMISICAITVNNNLYILKLMRISKSLILIDWCWVRLIVWFMFYLPDAIYNSDAYIVFLSLRDQHIVQGGHFAKSLKSDHETTSPTSASL